MVVIRRPTLPVKLRRITSFAGVMLVLFLNAGCAEKNAEDYLSDAATFAAQDDPSGALVALKNAVNLSPSLANARFELGKIHAQLNDYDSAAKELTRALELGYDESQIIVLLAESLHRSGANVALSDLRFSVSSISLVNQLEVGYRQLHALYQLNKLDDAALLRTQLLHIDANSLYKELIEAYGFIFTQQYVEAIELVTEAINVSPKNRDAIDLAARLHILNADIDNAAVLYANYLIVAPDDVEAKFSLAGILINTQPAQAEVYIDELLLVSNTNGLLNQMKAIARAAAGDYTAAKLFSEKAITGGRSDDNLWLIAGFASYKLGDFSAAIKHLSLIAEALPDNHPGIRMLADSQLQLGMGEEAGILLSRIDAVSPDDLALFSRAGEELIKAGNVIVAKQIVEKAGKVSETADQLSVFGALKMSLNDFSGLLDLESAVAMAPDSVSAKSTLASVYLNTNALDKAMALAQKWQQQNPTSVDGYLLEAKVLERQALYSQASEEIAVAKGIDATNIDVQLAQISIDMLTEDYSKAMQNIQTLLSQAPTNVMALASYLQVSMQNSDPTEAYKKIEQALAQESNNESLLLLGAHARVLRNEDAQALLLLNTITPNRLTPSAYWELQGITLLRTNNIEQALVHYTTWVDFFPNNNKPTINLLRVLNTQGRYAEAAQLAYRFNAQHDNVEVKLMEPYFWVMTRNSEKALEALKSVPEEYKSIPFLRGVYARIAILEKRGSEGVEDAKDAYISNRIPDNLLVYAQTLDLAGQSDIALNVIKQHVSDLPKDTRSKSFLAERYLAIDPASALAVYEEILLDAPNNPLILNNAGYLHMLANNLEKAFAYSQKAHTISPDNLSFADTHAQMLVKRKEPAKAIDIYERLITTSINDEEIILNYIEALMLDQRLRAGERKIQELGSKLKSPASRSRLLNIQATYLR